MSIYGMKPTFTDYTGYQAWRKQWAQVYNEVSDRIREQKKICYQAQLAMQSGTDEKRQENAKEMNKLRGMRVSANKLMTVLDEAKIRMNNITTMRKSMIEHQKQFPLEIQQCDRVDFHFNKKHLEFPWIPMWVLKTKGKTFYVNHVNASCPWSTRETPDNDSTKGSIRFRECSLRIDAEGIATLDSLNVTA